jgi:hypothetical protein
MVIDPGTVTGHARLSADDVEVRVAGIDTGVEDGDINVDILPGPIDCGGWV